MPPNPELYTTAPGLSVLRNGTPRSSSSQRSDARYDDCGRVAPVLARCGCTIPNALPSADIALTRKSGCAKRIARLIVGSTVWTTPTIPSGATTRLRSRTPALEPALSVIVKSSTRPRPWSACAGMNPHCSLLPSPSSWRSRSFSDSSVGTRAAASASVSRRSSSRSAERYAPRHRSAPRCKRTSGATSDRRRDPATGSRRLGGSTIDTSESRMHAPNSTMSNRFVNRAARATDDSGAQDGPVLLLVVEDSPRSAHDARQGVLVHVDGEPGLLAQQEVESTDQRAAAGHHDSAVDDVTRELGGRDLQRAPDGVDDLLDRLLDRFANLARMHAHRLRDAGDEVASLHFHLALLTHGRGAADLDLDLLGRRLADEQVVVLAHELHDRHVELVATCADRRVAHDARQRDHGDLRRAAADVDHHVARRGLHRQSHADRRRHRLGDHEDLLGSGAERRVAHRTLLHLGDPARHANDHARLHLEDVVVDDELQEVAQHLLGHVEVGDDAVLHRPDGDHTLRRTTEHALRLEPDPFDLLALSVDRHDRRLVEDDPLTLDVDQGVRGAEVDTDSVRGEQASRLEERPAHQSGVGALAPLQGTSRTKSVGKTPKATPAANHQQGILFSRPTSLRRVRCASEKSERAESCEQWEFGGDQGVTSVTELRHRP